MPSERSVSLSLSLFSDDDAMSVCTDRQSIRTAERGIPRPNYSLVLTIICPSLDGLANESMAIEEMANHQMANEKEAIHADT